MKEIVRLPAGEDLNEWLAINTLDVFSEICMLYDSVKDSCTPSTCAVMSAGQKYEYLWADGVKVIKPIKVCAKEYITLLIEWVEGTLNDEKIFPQDATSVFPKDFLSRIKNIFKRLFRVYAHIYCHHFDSVQKLGADPHLNTCFKHFISFVIEFDLIEAKETAPLQDTIDALVGKGKDEEGKC